MERTTETKPTPLDYAAPPRVPAGCNRQYLSLFLVATAVIGTAFWAWADWYAYIDDRTGGLTPKFELPLALQVGVSAAVGSLGGAAVAGLAAAWHTCRPRPRDRNPPEDAGEGCPLRP